MEKTYVEALTLFAQEYGYRWKYYLREKWMSGKWYREESAIKDRLQYLRNASFFGPAGLAVYKLRKF